MFLYPSMARKHQRQRISMHWPGWTMNIYLPANSMERSMEGSEYKLFDFTSCFSSQPPHHHYPSISPLDCCLQTPGSSPCALGFCCPCKSLLYHESGLQHRGILLLTWCPQHGTLRNEKSVVETSTRSGFATWSQKSIHQVTKNKALF